MEKWYEFHPTTLTLPQIQYTLRISTNIRIRASKSGDYSVRHKSEYDLSMFRMEALIYKVSNMLVCRKKPSHMKIIRFRNALICYINLAVKLCSRQASRDCWSFASQAAVCSHSRCSTRPLYESTAFEGNTSACYIVSNNIVTTASFVRLNLKYLYYGRKSWCSSFYLICISL